MITIIWVTKERLSSAKSLISSSVLGHEGQWQTDSSTCDFETSSPRRELLPFEREVFKWGRQVSIFSGIWHLLHHPTHAFEEKLSSASPSRVQTENKEKCRRLSMKLPQETQDLDLSSQGCLILTQGLSLHERQTLSSLSFLQVQENVCCNSC